MKLRGLGVVKECRTALFFLSHAATQGPAIPHLMGQGLAAHQAERPQRALMHYLIAGTKGWAGGEAANSSHALLDAGNEEGEKGLFSVGEGGNRGRKGRNAQLPHHPSDGREGKGRTLMHSLIEGIRGRGRGVLLCAERFGQ